MTYVPAQRVDLCSSAEYNEAWVHERIAENPGILGLGDDLILRDRERRQPSSGRLDMLLQDISVDPNRRYEVEIQLGATDPTHIIRTIEYWDIERRRYPQYDHAAVLVAEDITSRFLNVVGLFNGFIPLIAIQMQAVRVGEAISLVFTTVMDELPLGLDDEEDEEAVATDRAYWVTRGTDATVRMADQILEMVQEIDPQYQLKYNKFYIGLSKQGVADNFVVFRPRKQYIRFELRMQPSTELTNELGDAGLDIMAYSGRSGRMRVRLTQQDLNQHKGTVRDLLTRAYEESRS